MISLRYSYWIAPADSSGCHICLIENATHREKRFYVATGTVSALTAHMETLTDAQCDDWFPCVICDKPRNRCKCKRPAQGGPLK